MDPITPQPPTPVQSSVQLKKSKSYFIKFVVVLVIFLFVTTIILGLKLKPVVSTNKVVPEVSSPPTTLKSEYADSKWWILWKVRGISFKTPGYVGFSTNKSPGMTVASSGLDLVVDNVYYQLAHVVENDAYVWDKENDPETFSPYWKIATTWKIKAGFGKCSSFAINPHGSSPQEGELTTIGQNSFTKYEQADQGMGERSRSTTYVLSSKGETCQFIEFENIESKDGALESQYDDPAVFNAIIANDQKIDAHMEKELIPQILNTIHAEAPSTSSWQKYTDEKFGYEFEYPADYIVEKSYDTNFAIISPGPKSEYIYLMLEDASGHDGSAMATATTSFIILAQSEAKMHCATDGPGGGSDCPAIEKTSALINSYGFPGYEMYLTLSSGDPRVLTTKGPVYALDFSPTNYGISGKIRGLFIEPNRSSSASATAAAHIFYTFKLKE
jgi:hypothetical protein